MLTHKVMSFINVFTKLTMIALGVSLTKSTSSHQARTIAKETLRYWV